MPTVTQPWKNPPCAHSPETDAEMVPSHKSELFWNVGHVGASESGVDSFVQSAEASCSTRARSGRRFKPQADAQPSSPLRALPLAWRSLCLWRCPSLDTGTEKPACPSSACCPWFGRALESWTWLCLFTLPLLYISYLEVAVLGLPTVSQHSSDTFWIPSMCPALFSALGMD